MCSLGLIRRVIMGIGLITRLKLVRTRLLKIGFGKGWKEGIGGWGEGIYAEDRICGRHTDSEYWRCWSMAFFDNGS